MIHYCLQRFLWLIVKTLRSTYRMEIRGVDFKDGHNSYLHAVWHEEVFGMLCAHAWTKPYLALASRSKDGDFAAFISQKFGFTPVRGSSRKKNKDKGGKEAIEIYIQKIKDGFCGGITIDGPKGPRQVCKAGIAIIAQKTQVPIFPVITTASSYWEFNSWDKFKIPKPFSKVVVVIGRPVFVQPSEDPAIVDSACREIEAVQRELRKKFQF